MKWDTMLGDQGEKRVIRIVKNRGGEKAAFSGNEGGGTAVGLFSRNETVTGKNPTWDFDFRVYSWVSMNINSEKVVI